MTGHQSSQTLYPLNLLAQLANQQPHGCLQISSATATWSIYLDRGKLVYASNSIDPFQRLDRHLARPSPQMPLLGTAVREQLRLRFDPSPKNQPPGNFDYEAICWLVQHQYLDSAQAASLIEDLTKEVIKSFLSLREGTYELIDWGEFEQFPKFCHLDLRALAQSCQRLLQSLPNSESQLAFSPQQPNLIQRRKLSLKNTVDLDLKSKPTSPPSVPSKEGNRPMEKSVNASGKETGPKVYTVACIDDNPSVVRAIGSFLDNRNFSVLMIDDPVKALMQIVRGKPDLILLDVQMPKLDGYELCSLLRRHPTFKNTPIVMVTASTGFIDRAKAKLVRASDYMTKPFTQSQLLEMVHKHLPSD